MFMWGYAVDTTIAQELDTPYYLLLFVITAINTNAALSALYLIVQSRTPITEHICAHKTRLNA